MHATTTLSFGSSSPSRPPPRPGKVRVTESFARQGVSMAHPCGGPPTTCPRDEVCVTRAAARHLISCSTTPLRRRTPSECRLAVPSLVRLGSAHGIQFSALSFARTTLRQRRNPEPGLCLPGHYWALRNVQVPTAYVGLQTVVELSLGRPTFSGQKWARRAARPVKRDASATQQRVITTTVHIARRRPPR